MAIEVPGVQGIPVTLEPSKDILLRIEFTDKWRETEYIECQSWSLKTDGCLHIFKDTPENSYGIEQVIPLHNIFRITPRIRKA